MSRPPCLRLGALLFFACGAGLAAALPAMACEGAPWIRLEVTAGEMAGNDAAEWVEVDRDGCVLSRYPSWDKRAGVYQRSMSGSEKHQLAAVLDSAQILAFDEKVERQAILESESAPSDGPFAATLFTVSGADRYRLMIDESGAWKTITWDSPRLELERRRDIAAKAQRSVDLGGLQRLVAVIGQIQQSADHPDKLKIAEVMP